MDNEALKQVFKRLHIKITKEVNADSVIDELFSRDIISDEDYRVLRQTQRGADRCRELLSLLHVSSHPETFIQFRETLLNEYPAIVEEIDEQMKSLIAEQPRRLHDGPSTDRKCLLSAILLRANRTYCQQYWVVTRLYSNASWFIMQLSEIALYCLILHWIYLEWPMYKTAKQLLYTVYRTRNRQQLGRK